MISTVSNTSEIIAIVSGIVTIIGVLVQLLPILKYRLRKYLLLFTYFSGGFFAGLMITIHTLLGILAIVIAFGLIILSTRSNILLKLLADYPSTIVTKTAMYNLFCETVQKVCIALVGSDEFAGEDVRVSIFQINWETKKLVMVGRYPLKSFNDVPDIEHEVGIGVSGECAVKGKPIIEEDLPSWESDERAYIDRLSRKYGIPEKTIRRLNRKSRSYYNFPIFFREKDEQAHSLYFIVCYDSLHTSIKSTHVSSQRVLDVALALVENNKDLLIREVIGF